jgi:hypothetical protein
MLGGIFGSKAEGFFERFSIISSVGAGSVAHKETPPQSRYRLDCIRRGVLKTVFHRDIRRAFKRRSAGYRAAEALKRAVNN